MTDEKKYALQAKSIVKYYEDGNSRLDILKGIDLDVAQGEMVAIIGASGSGKSTLLHTLGLLDEPTSGEVLVNGTRTAGLSEKQRSQIRNQSLGFVYQFHHLLPEFSALDNVAMPLIVRRMDRGVARKMAEQVLAKVGLAERVTHKPSQLSGGERQRVALARALVANPVCVLADEPTGNLDRAHALEALDLIREVCRENKSALLLVSHDPEILGRFEKQKDFSEINSAAAAHTATEVTA